MWIVKNKKDKLLLFTEKPYRKTVSREFGSEVYDAWISDKGWCMEIVDDTFSYLTYDDEPVEVFLFAKEFIQSFGDACYEQGEKDACNFEYGKLEEGNLLIDEYITKNICG